MPASKAAASAVTMVASSVLRSAARTVVNQPAAAACQSSGATPGSPEPPITPSSITWAMRASASRTDSSAMALRTPVVIEPSWDSFRRANWSSSSASSSARLWYSPDRNRPTVAMLAISAERSARASLAFDRVRLSVRVELSSGRPLRETRAASSSRSESMAVV